MFIKFMAGPNIPHEQEAKILFASLKDLYGCFAKLEDCKEEGLEQLSAGLIGCSNAVSFAGDCLGIWDNGRTTVTLAGVLYIFHKYSVAVSLSIYNKIYLVKW